MLQGFVWVYVAVPLFAGAIIGSAVVILGWMVVWLVRREHHKEVRTVALRILTASVLLDVATILTQAASNAKPEVFGTQTSPVLIVTAASANLFLLIGSLCFAWKDDKPVKYITLVGTLILLMINVAAAIWLAVA